MVRFWIVGKKGMLSQAFQRILEEKGIDCFATSREEVDVTRFDAVEAQFEAGGFTHVINCSAFTEVDRAESSEKEAFMLNALGAENLAKLSGMHRKKFLHFSTDYVFDGEKGSPYVEKDECNPLSVYGKTKREGEKTALAICPDACVIRTSWLFGKEGNHFVKRMVDLMKKKKELSVTYDQLSKPTFCDDLVNASLLLLDQSGIFHFANKGETSRYEFTKEIFRRLPGPCVCQKIVPVSAVSFEGGAPRPCYSVLSTEKFEKLGYLPPRQWEECLDEVLC